jgi:beta-glucosidase/6-phospho-beta-glucosidase/beta-galactosidase
MPPLEIWGGYECTVNRIGDTWRDQTRLSGHQDRIEDLDLFASLGIKSVRYPVLWERTELEPGRYDWSWADARLGRLRELGVRPIVGLVHHGSGPAWTNLLDPGFAEGLADFAGQAARRYPWVRDWTPVNEPLTTARFSALYGHWYPHHRDERDFWRALIHQLEATRGAMKAIRAVNPEARLIQTEDFGRTWGTEPCAEQAAHENARRLATWDILTGRLTEGHPLWTHLEDLNVVGLETFKDDPCPPDVLGLNHYVTSDRFLDHRLEHYPAHAHGGNGVLDYADVEAVRVVENLSDGWSDCMSLLWDGYSLPIAVTECHLGCTPDEQVRWLEGCWEAAIEARRQGAEIEAITPWAMLGSHDWDSLLTSSKGSYESGVFDVSSGTPQPTPLATLVRQLAIDGAPDRNVADVSGWWREPGRLAYPAWSLSRPIMSRGRLAGAN